MICIGMACVFAFGAAGHQLRMVPNKFTDDTKRYMLDEGPGEGLDEGPGEEIYSEWQRWLGRGS